MEPFTTHTGIVAAMDRADVDTDQIIPKQFLKRIERTGFGQFLFFDWRFLNDGQPNPEFELNAPEYQGASILLVRRNFGSGSSREHAVWALADYGIRCLIGESFGDIFANNCMKNGVLPVVLEPVLVQQLFERRADRSRFELTVDLPNQQVRDDDGWSTSFQIDPIRKVSLLKGLDDIGMTLELEDKIAAYERQRGMTPITTH